MNIEELEQLVKEQIKKQNKQSILLEAPGRPANSTNIQQILSNIATFSTKIVSDDSKEPNKVIRSRWVHEALKSAMRAKPGDKIKIDPNAGDYGLTLSRLLQDAVMALAPANRSILNNFLQTVVAETTPTRNWGSADYLNWRQKSPGRQFGTPTEE